MEKIKKLNGFSGSSVTLYKKNKDYIVEKVTNYNVEKSILLLYDLKKKGFKVPNIYSYNKNRVTMEYIHGIDMITFLSNSSLRDINKLISFINKYIDAFKSEKVINFNNKIKNKLINIKKYINFKRLPFNYNNLFENVNLDLSGGNIHGDFTFDNIIYKSNNFYLIDSNPTELSSIYFDINKLRQDIQSYWFIRNHRDTINIKLSCIKILNELMISNKEMFNDRIFILMLLRILPYCKTKFDKDFIYLNIKKIWQS